MQFCCKCCCPLSLSTPVSTLFDAMTKRSPGIFSSTAAGNNNSVDVPTLFPSEAPSSTHSSVSRPSPHLLPAPVQYCPLLRNAAESDDKRLLSSTLAASLYTSPFLPFPSRPRSLSISLLPLPPGYILSSNSVSNDAFVCCSRWTTKNGRRKKMWRTEPRDREN